MPVTVKLVKSDAVPNPCPIGRKLDHIARFELEINGKTKFVAITCIKDSAPDIIVGFEDAIEVVNRFLQEV